MLCPLGFTTMISGSSIPREVDVCSVTRDPPFQGKLMFAQLLGHLSDGDDDDKDDAK